MHRRRTLRSTFHSFYTLREEFLNAILSVGLRCTFHETLQNLFVEIRMALFFKFEITQRYYTSYMNETLQRDRVRNKTLTTILGQ